MCKCRTIGGGKHLIHRTSRFMRLCRISEDDCNLIPRRFIHTRRFIDDCVVTALSNASLARGPSDSVVAAAQEDLIRRHHTHLILCFRGGCGTRHGTGPTGFFRVSMRCIRHSMDLTAKDSTRAVAHDSCSIARITALTAR